MAVLCSTLLTTGGQCRAIHFKTWTWFGGLNTLFWSCATKQTVCSSEPTSKHPPTHRSLSGSQKSRGAQSAGQEPLTSLSCTRNQLPPTLHSNTHRLTETYLGYLLWWTMGRTSTPVLCGGSNRCVKRSVEKGGEAAWIHHLHFIEI